MWQRYQWQHQWQRLISACIDYVVMTAIVVLSMSLTWLYGL